MADDKKEKLQLVDLAGIGNLLKHLIAEDAISCDEQDRIIQKIARDNDLAEHTLPILVGYGRSKSEVLERTTRKESTTPQYHRYDERYISLTDIARAHSDEAPGYAIQTGYEAETHWCFWTFGKRRIIPITMRALTENS